MLILILLIFAQIFFMTSMKVVMKYNLILTLIGSVVLMLALIAPDAFARGGGHGRSSYSSGGKNIYVHGYYRHDGTYVNSHYRSAPSSYRSTPYSNYRGSYAGDSDSRSPEPTPSPSTLSPGLVPAATPAASTQSTPTTPPAAVDSTPKKYKWHHPWFNTDMFSDSPPPWPYEVIEERNGIVLVKVTPPTAPNNPTPPLATGSPTTSPPSTAETAQNLPSSDTVQDPRYTEKQRKTIEVIQGLVKQTPTYQEGSLAGIYSGGGYSGSGGYGYHRSVHVRGYTRSNGTYVRSHYRSAPRRH